MAQDSIAGAVLQALGGKANIVSNAVCMTRLRVTLYDVHAVDHDALTEVKGVLGTATRGSNGLEVVFGPRMIEGVYRAFTKLTGIAASSEDLFPMSRQASNMRVQIRTGSGVRQSSAGASGEEPLINESEMSLLEDLFGKRDEDDEEEVPDSPPPAEDSEETEAGRPQMRLVVINGPNINMLGVVPRPGSNEDFPGLLETCKEAAEASGFEQCDCYQSNHEGDLVDAIQDAFGIYGGIVINPGAYGSSVALRDALRAVAIPAVEVHRHAVDATDDVGCACLDAVCGRGNDGYREAIERLAAHLGL